MSYWVTDLICTHPQPRPTHAHSGRIVPPSTPPPTQVDLTAAQHFDGSHARVPTYLFYVPSYPDEGLSHAAASSSTAQLTGNALDSQHAHGSPKMALPRPAPSEACLPYPDQTCLLLCAGYGCQPNPYHTRPCPVLASVAVHIIDDAAGSRLPHWHIGTPEPRQT